MDTDEKQMKHPTGLGSDPFGHLRAPPSGQGQTEEWRQRENARRAGRGRKDWWKKCLPENGVTVGSGED